MVTKSWPKISVKYVFLGEQAHCWQCGGKLPVPYYVVWWDEPTHSGVNVCDLLCLMSRIKDWKVETPESLKVRPSKTPQRWN